MVQNEITSSSQAMLDTISQLEDQITLKTAGLSVLRTPRDICDKYNDLQCLFKTTTNKKQKQAERDLRAIEYDYKHIKLDIGVIGKLSEMETELVNIRGSYDHTQQYLQQQTNKVCNILLKNDFMEEHTDEGQDNYYTLTELGSFSSNVAEIHPLPLVQRMVEWNYFEDFTPIQLVGMFSCFTDIKLPSDMRTSSANSNDTFINNKIKAIENTYLSYQDQELDEVLNTGIKYDNALCFDIIDIAMTWCECTTETECKSFIQNEVASKSISIGDFTKSMLKIVTISNEFINISQVAGNIELQHKLNQIEGLVLKYVTTSQSLYV